MEVSGLLLVDKPPGMTSHDVVGRVRRVVGQKSVGHCGTLDPFASGLLVLVLGEATKLSDYLLNADKSYVVDVTFGVTTDTLDRDGQVLSRADSVNLTQEEAFAAAERLQGELELKVPAFSAVKIKGKKLCEYARENKEVEIPTRKMNFLKLEPIEFSGKRLKLALRCTKGAYVRAWASQLGEDLGCGAMVEELRRTVSSPYDVSQAVSLEAIESSSGDLSQGFIPLGDCLQGWPAVTVAGRDEKLMSNGQIPKTLDKRLIFEQKQANREQTPIGIRVIGASSKGLISILEAVPNKGLKIKRSFRPQSQERR